jgi:hypothetical protein
VNQSEEDGLMAPDVLVIPPTPSSSDSMESFTVLDNVAWAREHQRGRRRRSRKWLRTVCLVASGAFLAATLLAGAWGAILYGLFK